MKVLKKINNNVALGVDGNNREVIIFGKGIGFEKMPYELTDMSKVDRTYYDIDQKYYGLLTEIPENIFLMVSMLLDRAKAKIDENLNPNLIFVLADHINFAVERSRKGMNISLPYSYELEYEYPKLTMISRWFVSAINDRLHTSLDKGEITSITMHFLNAMEGQQRTGRKAGSAERITRVIAATTGIVENYFGIQVDKNSFHYFRFKNHVKFFVQRKERGAEFSDSNEELYQSMKESYPDLRECVSRIDDYLEQEFGERCPHEELLYLMIHVNQLYNKEDCNRKGITPKD